MAPAQRNAKVTLQLLSWDLHEPHGRRPSQHVPDSTTPTSCSVPSATCRIHRPALKNGALGTLRLESEVLPCAGIETA